jgi:hypothetical protein
MCPFCNSEVDREGWVNGYGLRGPKCEGCGATSGNIELWNTRPIEDQLRAEVERDKAFFVAAEFCAVDQLFTENKAYFEVLGKQVAERTKQLRAEVEKWKTALSGLQKDYSMKLYLVTLQGMTSSISGPVYGEAYVLAENPDVAYKKVKKFLDEQDLGFSNDRQLRCIELLADSNGPYSGEAKRLLYL